jgi:hypothetical protein
VTASSLVTGIGYSQRFRQGQSILEQANYSQESGSTSIQRFADTMIAAPATITVVMILLLEV